MTLMPYTFIVLQYQHSPFAGERLNIGLLLVCEKIGFAKLKIRDSWKRFSDAYPDFDRGAVKADLKSLSVAASRIANDGFSAPLDTKRRCNTAEGLLLSLFGTPEGSIVWGSQGSGVTHDPEAELEKLHDQLIARFDHVSRHDRRDDDDVFQSLKSHLDDTHLLEQMTEHVVHSPRGDTDALERVKQEAKAEALREAATKAKEKCDKRRQYELGQSVRDAILALIPDQHKVDG